MDSVNRKGLGYLIREAKAGNREAMHAVIERLKPMIKKYCLKWGYYYDDSMEHELVEELIKVIHRYQPQTEWGRKFIEEYFQKSHEDA